ncbi:hypothetical protein GYMLUDRAFT_863897 [Collybiopsis luxurians FD-317 M1]|nr:hypothetical protein GYMLUDRAFT_863897 [Collybiopsis luxurians FD-317 M1]
MPNYSDSEHEIIDRIARNPHPQRLPKIDESSSSRESSPDGLRKRSFTPTSEDGDDEIPAIPNPSLDDTPPPSHKPVLRQPLGFASAFGDSSTSTTLNTYQARPPPGAPKKTTKPKKAKKKEEYATQTGRFRLSNYNPSAPSQATPAPTSPSVPNISNVHSLMNNGEPANAYPSLIYPTPTQHPQSSTMFTFTTPSTQTMSFLSNPQFTTSASTVSPISGSFPATQGPQIASHTPVSSKGKTPERVKTASSKSTTKTVKQRPKQASQSKSNESSGGARTSTTYYRRDYDSQTFEDDDVLEIGPSSSQVPPPLSKHRIERVKIKQSRPSRPASRMVTVLITDIRSGTEDRQLAEIVVHLKEADSQHPEYGFWANAQEIVESLQSGPSRIEGPARVYTMRGKYRQFFLRVHEDSSHEAAPANISITDQRILEIVVESATLPGEVPGPPKIPKNLRPEPSPELDDVFGLQESRRGRKRYRSTSENGDKSTADNEGSFSPERRSLTGSLSHHGTKKQKVEGEAEINDSDAELFVTGTAQEWNFDYETPTSDDDTDLDKKIVNRIDPMLQNHPDWQKVFQVRSRLPRVPAYVELYRMLKTFFDQYEGRRAPFKRNRSIRIRKIHILKALGVLKEDDEFSDLADADKFCANCYETLTLLELYGPEGTRLQDSEVKEMLENNSPPEKYAKPQKRFLRKLREIDEKWNLEHQQSILGEGSQPNSASTVKETVFEGESTIESS